MHYIKLFLLPIIIFLFASCCQQQESTNSQYLALIQGTLIQFDENDKVQLIENSYVLIKDSKIIETGEYTSEKHFPENTKSISVQGKFLVPGLVDGFAALNNQSYANAYLYSGVTTIIAVDGGRRGGFFDNAKPSPDFYRLESVGDDAKSTEEHIVDLENLAAKEYKIALLKYELRPGQVKKCNERAHELGMGTIGEFGFTTYKEACNIGVDAFVHTTRYSLDVAPDKMRMAVAAEPFSNDLNSPKWKYYQYLYNLDMDDERLNKHAEILGNCSSFIMPTMSLLYLDLPDSKNPWNEKVATIINAEDVNNPADKTSGKHDYSEEIQQNYTAMALQELKIENKYHSAGTSYLAGSGTDVWGTMPGISLHTELELLQKIGLSNTEILKSASLNFHKAFGWKIGKIEIGFEADILVLDKDPLKDIKYLKEIYLLVNNGKVIELQELLTID